jgi:hypothetical protein
LTSFIFGIRWRALDLATHTLYPTSVAVFVWALPRSAT